MIVKSFLQILSLKFHILEYHKSRLNESVAYIIYRRTV